MRIGLKIVVLAALTLPTVAWSQAAPYLKGAQRWEDSLTGISGFWNMTGHVSSLDGPRAQFRDAYTVEGKPPPMRPKVAAMHEKLLVASENGKPFAYPGASCMVQGIPMMLFAAVEGPIQILETPGQVTIISEEFMEVWVIDLDVKHRDLSEIDPSPHGDSVGHWEGDTLVVDTIGISTMTPVDYTGIPHSEDLRVETRIRRLDKDTMEVRATHYDPKTFTEPWTRGRIYKKARPGERMVEFICENQRNPVGPDGASTFITHDELQSKKPSPNKAGPNKPGPSQ
jgi:hypothetical protein